ncbi:hypothetical protein MY3296_008574 [Beauveria thailandica]
MSKLLNDTKHFGLAAAATQQDLPAQSDVKQSFPIISRTERIAVDKHPGKTSSGRAGDFAISSKDNKTTPVKPPESQPAKDKIVTWSLDSASEEESIFNNIHGDDTASGRESIFNKFERTRVDAKDLEDNGKYRSVVKIQSLWRVNGRNFWTMGTGCLIRDDLILTAGHNVCSDTYQSRAIRVKCWIGYRGRKLSNHPGVQHRNALNIATTEPWHLHTSGHMPRDPAMARRRDMAMIQVAEPFKGNLNPFKYIDTPSPLNSGYIIVVGYPGDKHPENHEADAGGCMFEARCPADYDLANEKYNHMITYEVDTYGGQSGAPILHSNSQRIAVIGTHCYGGSNGNPNSGNSIGGQYGNNYDEFVKIFKPSTSKTIPLYPKINHPAYFDYYEGTKSTSGENTENFWDIIKIIAKVGSVALPAVGTMGGPIGTLFGTVAGGIIGTLAESVEIKDQKPSFKVPEPAARDACFQRAELAEAAFQSVLRLSPSRETEAFWTKMSKTWSQNHFKVITSPPFINLATPIIKDYGYRLATDQWQKGVNPNPTSRHAKTGNDSATNLSLPPIESTKPNTLAFIQAFYHGRTRRLDGSEKESAEALADWLAKLLGGAIEIAKPIATDAANTAINHIISIVKADAESMPADDEDEDMKTVLQRAVMADLALQTLENMTQKDLEALQLVSGSGAGEEGFIDAIKTAAQQAGKILLEKAKKAMDKHLPGIIAHLKKGKTSPSHIYEESDAVEYVDRNPDEPPIEPFPPPERNLDARPIKRFPPSEPNPDAPPEEPFTPKEPR